MKLTIDMPWEKDLSVNHMRYGAGGGYRKKAHVQAWMDRVTFSTQFQRPMILPRSDIIFPPPLLPVSICVDFRWPTAHKRDDHNFYKVICDAVASGLGIDDKDIRISTGTIEVDRDNPGFTITVEDSE